MYLFSSKGEIKSLGALPLLFIADQILNIHQGEESELERDGRATGGETKRQSQLTNLTARKKPAGQTDPSRERDRKVKK